LGLKTEGVFVNAYSRDSNMPDTGLDVLYDLAILYLRPLP